MVQSAKSSLHNRTIATTGTVKLTDFLEAPLIDMPPKSLICRVGSNRFRVEKEWIQVNLTVPPFVARREIVTPPTSQYQ